MYIHADYRHFDCKTYAFLTSVDLSSLHQHFWPSLAPLFCGENLMLACHRTGLKSLQPTCLVLRRYIHVRMLCSTIPFLSMTPEKSLQWFNLLVNRKCDTKDFVITPSSILTLIQSRLQRVLCLHLISDV